MPEFITRSRRTEFQTRAEGDNMIIQGYFIVYNEPYFIDDYMEEVVLPGALDGCDMSDVRALVDHIPHLVLGRNTAGTLALRPDDKGLYSEITINGKDSDAVSLYARIQRGDVDQASFGFDEGEVRYIDLPDGRIRREIAKISKLWEISTCTFPAYESTYVEARSRDTARIQKEAAEHRKEMLKRRLRNHAQKNRTH